MCFARSTRFTLAENGDNAVAVSFLFFLRETGAELTEDVKPNCVHCLVDHRIRSIRLIGKSSPNGKLTKKPWLSALNTPKRAKNPDGSKSTQNMYVFFSFFFFLSGQLVWLGLQTLSQKNFAIEALF